MKIKIPELNTLFLGDSLCQNACKFTLRLGLEKKLSFVGFFWTSRGYAIAALSTDPANRMLLAVRVQKGGEDYWRWLSSPTQNAVEWMNHFVDYMEGLSIAQPTAPPKNAYHFRARA